MKNLQKHEQKNTIVEILLSITILSIAFILLVHSEVSSDSEESLDMTNSESTCSIETIMEPQVYAVDIPTDLDNKSTEQDLEKYIEESKEICSEKLVGLDSESDIEKREVVSDNVQPLEISEDDFNLFCYVAYAEAGGESYECIVGTMWEIRNGAIIRHKGDFQQEIYFPNRYSCVLSDGNVLCGQGIVTEELIPAEFIEIARQVIAGEISDPTEGALCYLGYNALGYPDPTEFAEKFGIEKYIVLGEHIFFYEWTEELNNL